MKPANELDQVPQLTPPEPGVQDFLDFIFLLVVDDDGAGLRRLWTLSNFVWDVGADAGDGVGRKMVQYENHLQRPNSWPEHAITIILNSAMILTHKNQAFHHALREDKIMEFLDALQTSSYISSKIELIRTILTVLLPF